MPLPLLTIGLYSKCGNKCIMSETKAGVAIRANFPDVYTSDLHDLLEERIRIAGEIESSRPIQGMGRINGLPSDLKDALEKASMELEMKKAGGRLLRLKASGSSEFLAASKGKKTKAIA